MISLSNSTAVTLAVGQAITFDVVNFRTGCSECHRTNSSSVKLRANGIYEINFHANVSGPAATALSLSVELGGEILNGGEMITTSSAADEINSVSITIPVRNCCGDFDRITIVNTGSTGLTLQPNSLLYIKRVA